MIISPHTGKPITSGRNGKVVNVRNGRPSAYVPQGPGFNQMRYSGAWPGIDRSFFGFQVPIDFWDSVQIDQQVLAANATSLYRSQPTIHAIVNGLVQHVVGQGRMPESRSEKGSAEYDAYFYQWAKKCSPNGLTFQRFQQIVFRQVIITGDIGVLKIRHKGQQMLQFIEGHRIGGAPDGREGFKVQNGVEYRTKGGEVSRYFVREHDEKGPRPVLPSEMLLVFLEESPTQYRGISALALSIIDALDESEIMDWMKRTLAWQASIGGVKKLDASVETNASDWRGVDEPMDAGASNDFGFARVPLPDDQQRVRTDGVIVPVLAPGESYEDFTSTRPNQNFLEFIKYVVSRMCQSVGLSYEVLLGGADMGDGPGTRKTMAEADRAICGLCTVLHEKLNNPVWEYVIGGAILRGELPAYPDWQNVVFQDPGRMSIDVGRESKALVNEVAAGLKTRDEIHRSEGRKWSDVLSQREAEEMAIMETANRIATKFGIEDVLAVRNAISSSGVVDEKPQPMENKADRKDSGKN